MMLYVVLYMHVSHRCIFNIGLLTKELEISFSFNVLWTLRFIGILVQDI